MKKLLLLLFSLMLSFNSYGEEVCYAKVSQDKDYTVSVYVDDMVDVDDDKLLTLCEEGDILVLSGFNYSSVTNSLFTSSRLTLASYMASYCDLNETQVIENRILVCKLVDRDI